MCLEVKGRDCNPAQSVVSSLKTANQPAVTCIIVRSVSASFYSVQSVLECQELLKVIGVRLDA